MRRILRKIAEGDIDNFGDTTTLLNPEIVEEIAEGKLYFFCAYSSFSLYPFL